MCCNNQKTISNFRWFGLYRVWFVSAYIRTNTPCGSVKYALWVIFDADTQVIGEEIVYLS